MKTFTLLCLITGSASAQTLTTANFNFLELRDAAIAGDEVRPAVSSGRTEPALLFPVVGSVAGGGGLFFRTEIILVNTTNRAQNLVIFWFPVTETNNCTRPGFTFTMNPTGIYVWPDFVSQALNTSGLGSVVIFAVNASGQLDTTARIDGFSRIWTPVPNFVGTISQSFDAQSINVTPGQQSAYGLRQDSLFRMNIGIFNYDSTVRTFDVIFNGLSGSGSTALSVNPCSMVLSPAPAGNFGAGQLRIQPRDNRPLWYGFGSSVDNLSGDNWSSVAHPE
jgi:hypothetical protein